MTRPALACCHITNDLPELTGLQLLKRILTAVVLIPIVLLLVLRAPVPVVALVAALVALLAVQELLKITEAYDIRPLHWPTYIFVGLFFLLLALQSRPRHTAAVHCRISAVRPSRPPSRLCLSDDRHEADDLGTGFPAADASAFAFAYVPCPWACWCRFASSAAGAFLLLYLLLVVWAGDIFAYFVGRSLGRHLMSPRISPRKDLGRSAGFAARKRRRWECCLQLRPAHQPALLNAH